MPAIIKIVISIKLIVMLLFLHQTNGFSNRSIKYDTRKLSTHNVVPGIVQDSIIMKWINMETTMKKAYFNLIRSLLPRAAMGMRLTSNVSHNCTYSLLEYFDGLRNMKTWAFKMLDGTGKLQPGIIAGNPMSFGEYDTCLEAEPPNRKFRGQYCYVEYHFPLPKRKFLTPVEKPVDGLQGIFEPESFFEYFANISGYLYSSQYRLTTCLPSTCSKEDIRHLFSNALHYLKLESNVKVPHCETAEEEQELTALEIFIFVLFGLLISLVVMGTLLDILQRNLPKYDNAEKSTTTKVLLCFSAYTNFLKLIQSNEREGTLRVFHGYRVLSTIWVIYSHAHFPVSYIAYDDSFNARTIGKKFLFQMAPLGFLAVETFFFMSSLLAAYLIVQMRGKISVPVIFLKRYLRLTPTMMLVVAFYSVIGRFGSGPIWKESVANLLSKNCLERGWTNLFYINNYTYSNKVCLGWTWYLSADTQIFLVTLYVCAIMRRRPSKGILVSGLVLIIGVLLTIFAHVYYKLPPTYLQSFLSYEDWYYYGLRGHTHAHLHLSACAIGIVVGYILATRKGHIPKHLNRMGWILSAVTFLIMMCLNHKWNSGMYAIPGVFVSALYASLHRIAWTLSIAFITISCSWGHGGIANSILGWQGFVPFARMTYMVYLVHYGLINVYTGYSRQSTSLNHRSLSFLFFYTICVSFPVALVLGLIFEAPLMALEKTFSGQEYKKQVQPGSATEKIVILKHSA